MLVGFFVRHLNRTMFQIVDNAQKNLVDFYNCKNKTQFFYGVNEFLNIPTYIFSRVGQQRTSSIAKYLIFSEVIGMIGKLESMDRRRERDSIQNHDNQHKSSIQ
ncbi:hypothetical protein VNO77_01193 [Canavalia gladiata]|uniref:Uncharacterized protein n=1 Tax=Canavalia gladiata TaxID=3824 RepID=A0AAN9R524_CANGL